jgi:NAD(P)H-nitrite reductase large subunit
LESLIKKDEAKYIYRKLVLKDGLVAGCILLGDLKGKKEILDAIEKRERIPRSEISKLMQE